MTVKVPQVLIVDDQEDIRWALRTMLKRAGMKSYEASNGREAIDIVKSASPDAMLLDVKMPGMDGFEVFDRIREIDSELPVILITAFGSIRDAVRMVKSGAYDYLSKPLHKDEVVETIKGAISAVREKRRKTVSDSSSEFSDPLKKRMGYSPKIVKLAEEVEKVAPTDIGVLIIGETGVGKEVVAQAIHSQSTRSEGEFVAMDCGAIPETLFESELFGHEKGAFTGANTRKIGKFEAAQNGTLFLDEITNIPLGMQSKFLRVLQEKTFFRIGSSKKMKANVRIIAATNKEFKRPSDWDEFRTDLYYRLAEYVLYVPALRERKEDILYLVKKFYRQANSELGKNVLGISEDALDYLFDHDWPGNVRELNNVIKRAVLLADEMIEKEHLGILDGDTSRRDTFAEQAAIEEVGDTPLKDLVQDHVAQLEKEVLKKALVKTGGNKAETARMLKIDYKTIHTKLKKYGITMDDARENESD